MAHCRPKKNPRLRVSIPKRVSEVLWHPIDFIEWVVAATVSIPKRVSEVLWLKIYCV